MNELDSHSNNESKIIITKLAKTIATLRKLPNSGLLLGEHFGSVLLIRFQLGQQNMCFYFVKIILLTALE